METTCQILWDIAKVVSSVKFIPIMPTSRKQIGEKKEGGLEEIPPGCSMAQNLSNGSIAFQRGGSERDFTKIEYWIVRVINKFGCFEQRTRTHWSQVSVEGRGNTPETETQENLWKRESF